MRTSSHIWIPLCLVLSVSYFSFFHQLGKQPMHMWDESSYALNAQEMLETGNPIEIQLLGKPDLYNSKPPFAIWCMAGCIRVFGFNEMGVRMAPALFALLSSLVLFVLGIKIFKNGWSALALPLVLASSYGYVGEHIARTGDTDCILAFWILLQSVLVFAYTQSSTSKQANMYLLLTGLAFSMGCLTKGIAGLTAVPGMVAWILYSRKLKSLLQTPAFYGAVVLFIVLVPGYYVLRNYLTPGYWDAVWHFEVGGRLTQQEFLNPETLPFYYYYQVMFTEDRLMTWITVLPLSIFYIIRSEQSFERSAGLACMFILAGVSFSLALSQTKLFWYDAPLYPLMAAIIGISFGLWIQQMELKYTFIFLSVFIWPFYKVLARNIRQPEGSHLRECMCQLRDDGHQKDTIHIINSDPNFIVYFYAKQDGLKGYASDVVSTDDPSLHPGSYILTEKYAREFDMNQRYILDTLFRYEECSYYRIIDKR